MVFPAPTIDHVVVNTRDRLDAAAAAYERLGFTLTPRGHHTLGSANHLAIFGTDYLELIGVMDPASPRTDVMGSPIGLNGLVFGTDDSAAVHAALTASGVDATPPREFSRPVDLPGGAEDAVFRTVHITPQPVWPGRVYFCHHFTRKLVWRDEWRHHANGAIAVARMVIASDGPHRLAEVFGRMFGPTTIRAVEGGISLAVGLARVDVLTPATVMAPAGYPARRTPGIHGRADAPHRLPGANRDRAGRRAAPARSGPHRRRVGRGVRLHLRVRGVSFNNLGAALFPFAPERVGLIDLSEGTRQFSFGEIDQRANAVAAALAAHGFAPGDRVAILSANCAEFLFAFLGTMRAGLVSVPINHKLPAATVALVLEDCDARLVIVDAGRRALLPAGTPIMAMEDVASLPDAAPATVVPTPSDPAMFLYTSGSTGRPKGVVLSHRSHLWVLDVRTRGRELSGERVLVAAPLYHMNGLAMSQLTLASGGVLILLPGFTARSYIEAAATWHATALTSVPPMIAMMLQEPDLLATSDLGSVQSIRMGSAPITQALVDRVRLVFPNAAISNGYGTTEAGPVVFAPHPGGLRTPDTSLGVAHPDVELRLVRDGAPVEDEGVLEMRCPALMNAYHKLPAATAKALTADGFYITGDVFTRDKDGFFAFVGRADDMFVSGGENIYPGEVETILETHPAIFQACVIALPDEIKGTKPAAFVVLRPGSALSEDEARAWVLARAPAYAHPRRVWFLPELPLAGTNKIDRKALLTRALAA